MAEKFNHQKNLDVLFETVTIRSAALLATSLLFIVEFQFDMERTIHLVALSLFALSIPLLSIIVVSANLWKSGNKFEKSKKAYHFGGVHNNASLLNISAIALCIFSYHWLPGILFLSGIMYTASMCLHLLLELQVSDCKHKK